jgi:hypothetical protein
VAKDHEAEQPALLGPVLVREKGDRLERDAQIAVCREDPVSDLRQSHASDPGKAA